MTPWNQVYDPFGNQWLSTFVASLPVIALLGMIASGKIKVHIAAVLALLVAFLVAVVAFGMPTDLAVRATILGMVTGMFPIGWIILNVIFLYRLTGDGRRRRHGQAFRMAVQSAAFLQAMHQEWF